MGEGNRQVLYYTRLFRAGSGFPPLLFMASRRAERLGRRDVEHAKERFCGNSQSHEFRGALCVLGGVNWA